MKGIRVTVVPVALRPFSENQSMPQLGASTLQPSGEWLSTAVADPSDAISEARRMLDEAVRPEVERKWHLENVGVDYSSGTPNLLLTAALPIAAVELDGSAEEWPLLTPWVEKGSSWTKPLRLDPVRAAMIEHWRGQLARTTAALDLLPRYFPTSQVRSVYSSVWGAHQAEANFQRWIGSARDINGAPLLAEVPDTEVRRETQSGFAARLADVGITPATLAGAWDPKIVGISAGVGAVAGLSAIPAAVIAGALVGASVGWQLFKGAGRPPVWYRRSSTNRVDLMTSYPVRPVPSRRPHLFVEDAPQRAE
jgi:hypothetical protein